MSFGILMMIIGLGLVLLVLGLALIPLRLQVLLGTDVKQLTVKFWKFTLVDSDRPAKVTAKPKKTESKPKADKSESKPSRTIAERWKEFLGFVEIAPKMVKAVLAFAVRALKKLNLHDVHGSISGGLADPADTGMAFGALYAILGATPKLQKHLQVKPDYAAESIEYNFQGEVALRPFSLIGPTLKLVIDLPKWDLIKMIKSRRKLRKLRKLRGLRKRQDVTGSESSS